MFDISGKTKPNGINQFMHSAMVDESYKLVCAHVDSATRQKIQGFGYTDLAKLLARDKIIEEEDKRLTWIN